MALPLRTQRLIRWMVADIVDEHRRARQARSWKQAEYHSGRHAWFADDGMAFLQKPGAPGLLAAAGLNHAAIVRRCREMRGGTE